MPHKVAQKKSQLVHMTSCGWWRGGDIMIGNLNKIIGMSFKEVDMHAYIVYFCN